ncbi:MAG: anaerobic ribonucleoside-triphosphate reductase activating protein [Candidatus Bathyarchaeota archaeon]|jgi:pyruvate formate lyase activating enzyme|uniref:anaerobic ribonucleoside-triphosphate reductase activating protein n=1 Tax=Candidatus Bathycorpusculum sp. TaxID=2994959 RepID=UPI002816F02D|nr:anaerobic ribonucleoside-triphosphate reductase activating protein [Candidatus Termiticorpusculum sp.]MCL2257288.1 anaerobic ribonucleoside-triphosphate reductase activating protein [Candidatus Termiticorpusculum sp.]MCL2292576.1 anaerobic ribonucleoside-triphosphate reductase activating protein [Candidatus Termiticorpusculum sp.]
MKFSGLQKTSLLDYPDKVSSVLFTPGCNLRCPYCHNADIVLNPQPPFLQETTALEILEQRKKYIDAVVITGGEPCMHKELPKFLAKLKEQNFFVKLDTNGFYPETLQESLQHIDYVALDIKTSIEKYKQLGMQDTNNLQKSINILKTGKTSYEFRTTLVPELVTLQDIEAIGELSKGSKNHALQKFISEKTLDKHYQTLQNYTPETINKIANTLSKYTEKIILRI